MAVAQFGSCVVFYKRDVADQVSQLLTMCFCSVVGHGLIIKILFDFVDLHLFSLLGFGRPTVADHQTQVGYDLVAIGRGKFAFSQQGVLTKTRSLQNRAKFIHDFRSNARRLGRTSQRLKLRNTVIQTAKAVALGCLVGEHLGLERFNQTLANGLLECGGEFRFQLRIQR